MITKGDSSVPTIANDMDIIRTLQANFQRTESRLKKVEEARKIFGETQQKMDEKMDAIYKLMSQWNNNSGGRTTEKPPHRFRSSPNPPPPPHPHHNLLTLTCSQLMN
jgi:predicted DNA-binding protein YlxM (UPF0122 family)